jgi:hypothetical protein
MKVSNYREKIVVLWVTFLLGTLFHTDLGLMPLFHGKDVANEHAHGDVSWIFWLMLAFFAIPMFAMIATVFTESRRYRRFHFGLTLFYSTMNFFHTIADIVVQPTIWYQVTLMTILLAIGLLLNWVSWQWMRDRPG